jgi:hypothetical protein
MFTVNTLSNLSMIDRCALLGVKPPRQGPNPNDPAVAGPAVEPV